LLTGKAAADDTLTTAPLQSRKQHCSKCGLQLTKSTHPTVEGVRYCPIAYPEFANWKASVLPTLKEKKTAGQKKRKTDDDGKLLCCTYCGNAFADSSIAHRQPDTRVNVWWCEVKPFGGGSNMAPLDYDEWLSKYGNGLVEASITRSAAAKKKKKKG